MEKPYNQIKMIKTLIQKSLAYKSEVVLIFSGIASSLTALLQWALDTSFIGVSVLLIIQTAFLIVMDFLTGIMASQKKENYRGIESGKITYTILKFVMFFVWLWMAYQIKHQTEGISWFEPILSAVTLFPIFLINLREFVSIGENIETTFGNKPYIFRLIDKIFEALEKFFINKLDSGQ